MPIVRCSKEVYEKLQREALDTGNPVSIVLDRFLFPTAADPKPASYSPADPKPARKKKQKPVVAKEVKIKAKKMRARCDLCGKEFQTIGAARMHVKQTHKQRTPEGIDFLIKKLNSS